MKKASGRFRAATGGHLRVIPPALKPPLRCIHWIQLHCGFFAPLGRRSEITGRHLFQRAAGAGGETKPYPAGVTVEERAQYSAFGERTVLVPTPSGAAAGLWEPQGFRDPLNPSQLAPTAPNLLSEPQSHTLQTMGFQGRRHEDLPGAMNFRNRLNDPRLGRFLERDPVSDPNNPNPYAFEANNPVNNFDPMGTWIIMSGGAGSYIHALYDIKGVWLANGDYLIYSMKPKAGAKADPHHGVSVGNLPDFANQPGIVYMAMNQMENRGRKGPAKYQIYGTLSYYHYSKDFASLDISYVDIVLAGIGHDWITANKARLPDDIANALTEQLLFVQNEIIAGTANREAQIQSSHVDDLNNSPWLGRTREFWSNPNNGQLAKTFALGSHAYYSTADFFSLGAVHGNDVVKGRLDTHQITVEEAISAQRINGVKAKQ